MIISKSYTNMDKLDWRKGNNECKNIFNFILSFSFPSLFIEEFWCTKIFTLFLARVLFEFWFIISWYPARNVVSLSFFYFHSPLSLYISIYVYMISITPQYIYIYIYIYIERERERERCRRFWFNGYLRGKWTWQHKFKSRERLFPFPIALFSLQLWVK